ncbi:MAG: rRNA pseudouridine synthase [Acidipropionibacterium sp.]|jgi:23S rRNA pseudouridine2605 synthase|nr:rRNA pseudouridine synthase [Acidipropionibacterium sp.]
MSDESPQGVRLQKVLAQAGVASRRAAEEMIADGRVEVNGEIIIAQGRRVDPEHDEIRVDGSRIPTARRHLYYVLNKPRGVVSTMDDPDGRACLADLEGVPNHERLFHVGRLDTETEGLILLTNDGEFAYRMAHPSYKVLKTYLAEVEGFVDDKVIRRLTKGVTLEDGPVHPDSVRLVQPGETKSLVEVGLHEGRNRIVRRMMDSVAHPVRRLSRTAIGPVRVGRLGVGDMRPLTREELGKLFDLVNL